MAKKVTTKPKGGPVDKAKAAKKEAFAKKRNTRLAELEKEQPKKYLVSLNYKEAKEKEVTFPNDEGKNVTVTNRRTFCLFRARALYDYWEDMAKKPAISEKVLARKKARLDKLKEMMKALEDEIGGDDDADATE